MIEKMKKILPWLSLIPLTIGIFLVIFSTYMDKKAEKWVSTVTGNYIEGTFNQHGFLVHWDRVDAPPSCPVTIHAIFSNNGYAIADFGDDYTAEEHHAIHLSKNGKTSPEPIGELAYNFIKDKPGEWHYKLEFTFHCSTISKNQYFFWLNFDNTYTVKPVIINVEDNNDS